VCEGPTHAIGGVAFGLGAAAAYGAATGHPTTLPVAVVCGLLGAGAAMANDLDHHNSTATNSAGAASDAISRGVRWLSIAVFDLTATPADRARFRGAHRGLTHTGFVVPLLGAFFAGLCGRFGWPAILPTLWLVFYLAVRGLPPVQKPRVDAVQALGMAAVGTWLLPHDTSGVVIGAAVAAGVLSHTVLDGMTTAGVPFSAPFWKRRGQRWWRWWFLPRCLRFPADSETAARVVSTLSVVAAVALFPGVFPFALHVLAAIRTH